MSPRGIRNNNPGNIRWGENWQGLVPPEQRTDKSFCQFTSPEYGIRAMIKIIRTYKRREEDGVLTIRDTIAQWAPPNENDTNAYIRSVAAKCNAAPESEVATDNFEQMHALLRAIIKHENSGEQPYSDATFKRAWMLAMPAKST